METMLGIAFPETGKIAEVIKQQIIEVFSGYLNIFAGLFMGI
jgi:hypothetical protein